jgi:hypothetical protein
LGTLGEARRPVEDPTLAIGKGHAYLPRGTIGVSEPRELLAVRSPPGAYERDGTIAKDTLGLSATAIAAIAPTPAMPAETEVVDANDDEVIWGGTLSGHYGHFLVDSLARLWPLSPGGQLEGLPVVFRAPKDESFARLWLEAFGARTIFLPKRGAVRFKRMLVPELSWHVDAWIAAEMRDTHLAARRGMDVPRSSRSDVLWLSRAGLERNRIPYDEALLEWILGDLVTPVKLETMALTDQISVLEGSKAVAGAVGSAFHTLLLTVDTPDSLYLCPSFAKGVYAAQHRILDGRATFLRTLSPVAHMHRVRHEYLLFPDGYRFLIPEALAALSATFIPDLMDDPRLAAFAHPERWRRHGKLGELDSAVMRVLRDPCSPEARSRLGTAFEGHGHGRCAREQFTVVAELASGS